MTLCAITLRAVHVALHGQHGYVHVLPAHALQARRIHHAHQHLLLLTRERIVQVALDKGLRRTQSQAQRQHLRVSDGGAREGERAGVLVDAQREDGGFERADVHLPPAKDVHHGTRLSPIRRDHPVLPLHEGGLLEPLLLVMVEDDDLHALAAAQLPQLPQPAAVGGVHHYQAADGVKIGSPDAQDGQVLPVQRDELAHVAVEGARRRLSEHPDTVWRRPRWRRTRRSRRSGGS